MRLNQNNNGQNTCGQASGQPTRLLHADGYVDVSAQVPVFYYHLKDHLGNVRLVITPAGSSNQPEIVQAMEYYPFGMRFESSIPYESDHSHMPNKHTYNSNEEQEMPGRWLDYGFRFYDSQIARFHSVDPLAHSFSSQSPYVYAGNNPILNIDFMGLSAMSNVSNKRTSSFTLEMTDEDFIKATRPIGLEGVESKEKKKKTDKNTESQTSQQNGNGKKKKDGKGNVAKGQGGVLHLNSTASYIYDGQFKKAPLIHSMQAGQHVRVEVKNMNVLGVQLDLQDKSRYTYERNWLGVERKVYKGDSHAMNLLPGQTRSFDFYMFTYTPTYWQFEISTRISGAANVQIRFYSDWIPGMPYDPDHVNR